MQPTLSGRVRFGSFELDLRAGELRGTAQDVVLPEQQFQVLRTLVEHAGVIVTREEIKKKLWPNNTVVEFDHGINTTIRNLRRALGDSADSPQYIETLAHRGYRLIMPVEWIEAAPDASLPSQSLQPAPEVPEVKVGNLTGKTVSHYRVLEIIGGGGMGLVYRAEDIKLGRLVALKFLPEEFGDDPKARERFEREAHAVSALDHPNICTVYEFDEYEGHPFIAMQSLHGKTLREHLAEGAFRLLDPAGLDIAIQVASGLEAAHEQGIIHRDIKPANIFITEKNVGKILDFGVAKLVESTEAQELSAPPGPERSSSTPIAPHLTRTGLKLGTAGYMSPEQIRGEPVDAGTDIFSFGLVLYEMATGERAFSVETEAFLQPAILTRDPRPVRDLIPDISPELAAVITKCMEKDREQRYASASELHRSLVEVQHGSEPALPQKAHLKSTTRRWIFGSLVAFAVAWAMIGGVKYWRSHRTLTLTDKDSIVVVDFDNKTGDAVFDDTLKTALTVALNQSPFLNVLSDKKVAETLKLMDRPGNTRLMLEVARELCMRASSKAYIGGSIATLGNDYVVELKAVNCKTGETLAQEQVTANRKESVLEALGGAAAKLRAELGERFSTIQKFDTPLEEATTPSLEALQAYSLATIKGSQVNWSSAIPFLQRAIELDPNFAMAYAYLAAAYDNLGENDRSQRAQEKAYSLRQRVTDRERLRIDGTYYRRRGEVEKAIQTFQLWKSTYPLDVFPYDEFPDLYGWLGDYSSALAAASEAFRRDPSPLTCVNLVQTYLALGRVQEARQAVAYTETRFPDNHELVWLRYWIAFYSDDRVEMKRLLMEALSGAEREDFVVGSQCATEAYYGRLKSALATCRRSVNLNVRDGWSQSAAGILTTLANTEAYVGNPSEARQLAAESLSLVRAKSIMEWSALAYANSGDVRQAQALADELARAYSYDTLLNQIQLPTVRASIEVKRNNPSQAIQILEKASPIELGLFNSLIAVYTRGQAYLLLGRGSDAAAEFQKILDHRGVVYGSCIVPLAHLSLARAYAMQGDTAKAKTKYQDFLNLWNDADPDIPIYQQAKAEYAKLQ